MAAWTWLIAAGLSLLLAAWLARVGWSVTAVRHLVVFLVAVALFDVANGTILAPGDLVVPWQALAVAIIILPAAAFAFYRAYQTQGDGKTWTWQVWAPAGGLAVLTVLFPSLFASISGGQLQFGPVFVLYGLNYLLFAGLAFELTRDAIKEETDAGKRRSMLWLALGFSFLPAYVATSEFFFIDILKLNPISGLFFQLAHFASLAAGLVLLALFVILARAALRTKAEQQKVDVAWFLLAIIAPGASVLVQLLFVAFDEYSPQMSVAVEGVWAMLVPLFIAIAVARYRSFGLTNDSRPGLRIMLFAFIWPAAFGLGWMAATNSFQDSPKWLVGLIFTALPLPFVKILWRQSFIWASKILGAPSKEAEAEAEASDA